jgi:hypothetical protein
MPPQPGRCGAGDWYAGGDAGWLGETGLDGGLAGEE